MTSDPPSHEECVGLLRAGSVGRVGFVVDGRPRVFPVNYGAGEQGEIVFRTGEHGLLSRIGGTSVAFEIDGFDSRTRSGWSVQVLGVVRDVTDEDGSESARLRGLAVESWDPRPKLRWFVVDPEEISGRRVAVPEWSDELQGWFAGVPMS